MKVNFRAFKADPYFFLKYFFIQLVSSSAVLYLLLIGTDGFSQIFNFTLLNVFLLPVAVLVGVQGPTVLHNAVHFNLKPMWLNEVLGEFLGFFVLFGLGPFRISHFLHHAYSDTVNDPHPPNGRSFWWFLATTQVNTIKVIRKKFLDIHGRTIKNHLILAFEMSFYYVSLMIRPVCWYLLLGPTLFLTFYLPAYITNVFVFAHINFITHQTNIDGSVEVINLNHNLYYKAVNFLGSGVYFHKNHHLKPTLYNPSKLDSSGVKIVTVAEDDVYIKQAVAELSN